MSEQLRIGSLFSGYGGLDLAVEAVTGAKPAWFVEFDEAPSKILAHHWPDVPNYGDVTKVNWDELPPVDIITGGYPCQPFSQAGQRKGTNDERHLWPYVWEAIRRIRPRFAFLENVSGHRSLGFDSVLADLAEGGANAEWTSIRASDVGAPHHRERIFIMVTNPGCIDGGTWPVLSGDTIGGEQTDSPKRYSEHATDSDGQRLEAEQPTIGSEPTFPGDHGGFRTLSNSIGIGFNRWGTTPNEAQEGQPHNEPFGFGDPIGGATTGPTVLGRMLPTPNTMDSLPAREGEAKERQLRRGDPNGSRRSSMGNLREDVVHIHFDKYAPAVRRWERVTGMPAPAPTKENKNGRPHLNPAFAEWMMGLPNGWVTAPEIGLTRAQQLKAIGNGVCPQQGAAALTELLERKEAP